MKYTIGKLTKGFKAEIKIPGDKSISHRSIIFGSIAKGKTVVNNFLNSADCLGTKKAFEALGVKIEENFSDENKQVIIHGEGFDALKMPQKEIYLGNSGTSIRLLSGLFSTLPFTTTLTGDESLSKRPMQRVIKPLREMGAELAAREDKFAPLIVKGGNKLQAIDYVSPIASAQVKSCILLAGLKADGVTSVSEDHKSRNHTELMLKGFGADLTEEQSNGLFKVSIKPLSGDLQAQEFSVPGDISSAAFFLVAGAIIPNSELTLKEVGINPTRTGIIDVLKAMNVDLQINNQREAAGEPIADLIVKSSNIKATEISGEIIPRLIDEIPIIAILAAQAEGTTVIKDAEELRVKESDRVATTINMLRAFGADVEEKPDGMIIKGRSGEAFEPTEISIDSHGDHRIAMSSAIAALHANQEMEILQTEFVETSFPNFFDLIDS